MNNSDSASLKRSPFAALRPEKGIGRLLGLAAAAVLVLCSTVVAQEYTIRFSSSNVNPTDPILVGMAGFAERVKERSGGRIEITVASGDQLGSQQKVNEMIMSGANLMGSTDFAILGSIVPDLGILSGPYLYPDLESADRLFASDVYAELKGKLEEKGIKILSTGLFGVRHIIADKPIRKPEDLNGLTIRLPPSPIMMGMFSALGARPVQMPFSDVYNALQTGVVDAAESPLNSLAGSKLYEVKSVVSQTAHQTMFATFIISTSFFNSLPEDLQAILVEEGAAMGAAVTKLTVDSNDTYAQQLIDAGVEMVTDVDIPAFVAASRVAYDTLPGVTPGIYDRVVAAMAP